MIGVLHHDGVRRRRRGRVPPARRALPRRRHDHAEDGVRTAYDPGAAAGRARRPRTGSTHASTSRSRSRRSRPTGIRRRACRCCSSRGPTSVPSPTVSRSAIPALGSIILTHERDGVVQGLKDWKPDDRPPVAIPFFAFRIMVGCGRRDARAGRVQLVGVAEETAGRCALVPEAVRVGVAARLRRRGRRMGHDGGRAPALGSVRPRPHARRRHAVARERQTSWCRSRSTLSRTSSSSARVAISSRACCGPARSTSGRRVGPQQAGTPRGRSPRRRKASNKCRPSISFRYGPASSPWACSCTCCSTASISASASCFRTLPTTSAAI